MSLQPNILLIMPDQMRGDCFGLAGHPAVITPNIDSIGGEGCFFQRAYSTCPSCIPARRSLLTGQYPATSGSVGFATPGYDTPTLPALLSGAGYRSILVGRNMHQNPRHDENPGYDTCILGSVYVPNDDYSRMLDRAVPLLGGTRGLGISFNGWQAKSWPLAEYLHPTNWVVHESRQVIAGHDDSRPLFLTASFYAPHPPLIPPDFYNRRYLDMDLPDKALGDWVGQLPVQYGVDSPRVNLEGERLRFARAAYYGLINHLDDQLTWLMTDFVRKCKDQKRPWVIVFTSDHGEMLGDHYYFRKCEPFEGSCRIPLLIRSGGLDQKAGLGISSPVCLEDILPTLLDLSGIPIPDHVDGVSLVPLLRGESRSVRRWLHCEHSPCYSDAQAFQMVTDGVWKYIWRPMTGEELLFDLNNDPTELENLGVRPAAREKLEECRKTLIDRLRSRPEQFVVRDKLCVVSTRYPPIMKGKRV
ncbi:MAG: sulfatase-like hydrolase/transferase [Kiritimatiellaeota bacterium]|nr:sulfatase-like hydrolase/transferase [Kiritimatiellota bacterium]